MTNYLSPYISYELSNEQKRMLNQSLDTLENCHIYKIFEIPKQVKPTAVEQCLTDLLTTHDILRSSFPYPIKHSISIHSAFPFTINYFTKTKTTWKSCINSFIQPFNLSQPPLWRAALIELKDDPGKNLVIIDVHPLIADEAAIDLIFHQLLQKHQSDHCSYTAKSYSDYIDDSSDETAVISSYGNAVCPLTVYAGDNLDAASSSSCFSFEFGKELAENVQTYVQEEKLSLESFLFSTLHKLWAQYSLHDELIIDYLQNNRTEAYRYTIGNFSRQISVASKQQGDEKFIDFAKRNESVLNQHNGKIEALQNRQKPKIAFSLGLQNLDISCRQLLYIDTLTEYALHWKAASLENKIFFTITYDEKIFSHEIISRMSQHYMQAVKSSIEKPDILIRDINILTYMEKDVIFNKFNPAGEKEENRIITQVFEERAGAYSNHIALHDEYQEMSYKLLDGRSNQIGHYLKEQHKVKPDQLIGLLMEHVIERPLSVLSIWKAGAAFVPMDMDWPVKRKQHIIKSSSMQLILTTESTLRELIKTEDLSIYSCTLFCVDSGRLLQDHMEDQYIFLDKCSIEPVKTTLSINHLAYVIFTSGTTGEPKGVMVEHKGLTNLQKEIEIAMDITPDDRVSHFLNAAFDASIGEILMGMFTGATLYVVPKQAKADFLEAEKYLAENKITKASFSPSYLANMNPNNLPFLKKVTVGGEASMLPVVNKWRKTVDYVNAYGPTENTVVSSMKCYSKVLEDPSVISIGKPIANHQMFILDQHKNLQPVGVTGELYVSGIGLARGYLHNSEKTDQYFIDHPYMPGERIYKTGDLARLLPDGDVQLLGRIDHQVQLRGIRIDLSEIKKHLLEYAPVTDAAVIIEGEGDTAGLAAYVVATSPITSVELREYLEERLPLYMVPSIYIKIEKIPLTQNDKIDLKELKMHGLLLPTGKAYEAPVGETEEILAGIWEELLHLKPVSVLDDFFVLGGNSLQAAILTRKVHQMLNVALPVNDVFRFRTIRDLTEHVQKSEISTFSTIKPAEEGIYYPASSAQKRMFAMAQYNPESVHYNVPHLFMIEGTVNYTRIEQAFRSLLGRHEVLRTVFDMIDGELIQKIQSFESFALSIDTCSEGDIDKKVHAFIQPFNLQQDLLLRAGLLKIHEKQHLLIFDLHHIITDGVSGGILLEELMVLYQEEELQAPGLQYKDYAVWEQSVLLKEIRAKQGRYWLDKFQKPAPVLDLTYDYLRPPVSKFAGKRINVSLDCDLVQKMKEQAAETGSTIYMILLATYNILLSKYSGQKDITVGTAVAGRPHIDLQNMPGMFVNTLALRSFPNGSLSVRSFLEDVKKHVLEAFENQSYPFEELVQQLGLPRDVNRHPLFTAMFVLENMEMPPLTLPEMEIKRYDYTPECSKFDLTLIAEENHQTFQLGFEYNTQLFERETIDRMKDHFIRILESITTNLDQPISAVNMLTTAETKNLLSRFNPAETTYPTGKTLTDLFENQVRRTPDQT
ncbi:amino acid adenylation domain-containing protein, partial [Viridibacillus sp. YIM B01967]